MRPNDLWGRLPEKSIAELVSAISAETFGGDVYVLGHNVYAERFRSAFPQAIPFAGDARQLATSELKLAGIAEQDAVVVMSGGRIHSAMDLAYQVTPNVVHFFDFLRFSSVPLGEAVMNEGFAKEWERHRADFMRARDRFFDEQSRRLFDAVLGFRRSLNIAQSPLKEDRQDHQYFEEFLPRDTCQFVDVGAFDGKTTMDFLAWSEGPTYVIAIEPDAQMCQRIRQSVEGYPVSVITAAVSDREGTSRLGGSGSTSRIVARGVHASETRLVRTMTLDGILEKVSAHATAFDQSRSTLIKLDIEGAERRAIRGATSLFASSHVSIACAVYHSPDDLWRIPLLLSEKFPEHRLYFRHYTESIYESVVYAVPA